MAIVGPGGARSAGHAIRGGADLVQVRAKELSARALVKLVRAVIAEVGAGDKVIVSSRPDIAELAGARGVHLPESGLDPRSVRLAFPALAISVSRHDRTGLERAVDEGVDCTILGPIFGTPGKEGRALGLARFREMVRGLRIPVLAVGGITPANVASLIDSGASGMAAIRPFEDPRFASSSASAFRTALDLKENDLSDASPGRSSRR